MSEVRRDWDQVVTPSQHSALPLKTRYRHRKAAGIAKRYQSPSIGRRGRQRICKIFGRWIGGVDARLGIGSGWTRQTLYTTELSKFQRRVSVVFDQSYCTTCIFLHNEIDSMRGGGNGQDEEVSDKDGRAQERKDTGVVKRRPPRT
jgi:hypothetical protein